MSERRAAAVYANRPRGIYIPAHEVPMYLAGGWQLLDDCPSAPGAPSRDEALLLPPPDQREEWA